MPPKKVKSAEIGAMSGFAELSALTAMTLSPDFSTLVTSYRKPAKPPRC